MGFGITLNTEIYYNRADYKSKSDVQKRIADIEDTLSYIKSRLLQYAYMTEPDKFINVEGGTSIMEVIDEDVNSLLEDYDELVTERSRLWILEEAWDDCHYKTTGKALVPYNPNELNRRWMHGDYVDCCTPDGKDIEDDYWSKYEWNTVE